MEQNKLFVGAFVTLQGLQKATHLNGRRGIVASEPPLSTGRVTVKLFPQSENKQVSIKPENLKTDLAPGKDYIGGPIGRFQDGCRNCRKFLRASQLNACARCRLALYCSRSCQREHWKKEHKGECLQMRKARKGKDSAATCSLDPNNASPQQLNARLVILFSLVTRCEDAADLPRAEKLLQDGIAELQPMAEQYPHVLKPLYSRLALSVFKQPGRINEAVIFMERAALLQGKYYPVSAYDFAETSQMLGNMLFQQGDYHRAIDVYWRAYHLNPEECFDVLNNIGFMQRNMGNLEHAEEAYLKFAEHMESLPDLRGEEELLAAAYNNLAWIHHDRLVDQLKEAALSGRSIASALLRNEKQKIKGRMRKAIQLSKNGEVFQEQRSRLECSLTKAFKKGKR